MALKRAVWGKSLGLQTGYSFGCQDTASSAEKWAMNFSFTRTASLEELFAATRLRPCNGSTTAGATPLTAGARDRGHYLHIKDLHILHQEIKNIAEHLHFWKAISDRAAWCSLSSSSLINRWKENYNSVL